MFSDIKLLGLLLLSLVFSSCSTHVVTDNKPLFFDTPSSFYNNNLISFSSTHQIDNWNSFFGSDLELDFILKAGIKNSLTLRTMASRIEQASNSVDVSSYAMFPVVGINANSTQSRSELEDTGLDITSTSGMAQISVGWEIDLWKKMSSLKKASLLIQQASAFDLQSASLSLIGNITQTWYGLKMQIDIKELVKKQENLERKQTDILQIQLQGGVDNFNALQQEKNMLSLQDELLVRESSIASHKNKLASLLGITRNALEGLLLIMKKNTNTTISQPLSIYKIKEIALKNLNINTTPKDLLVSRPDLRSSFLKLQAQDYKIASSIANYWPSLTLNFVKNIVGLTLNSLDGIIKTTGSINIASSLFNFPALSAKVKNEEYLFDLAYTEFNQKVLNAIKEVEDFKIAEYFLSKRVLNLISKKEKSKEIAKIAKDRYLQGTMNYKDLLSYLNQDYNIDKQILSTNTDLMMARKNLLLAIGVKEDFFLQYKDKLEKSYK
jgi:multidrug efflux system outer membrane protein